MWIRPLNTKQSQKPQKKQLQQKPHLYHLLLKAWVGVGERCSKRSGVWNAWKCQILTHRGHSLPASWVASGDACRSEVWLWLLAPCAISPGTSALWKEADQMAQGKIKIRLEKMESLKL